MKQHSLTMQNNFLEPLKTQLVDQLSAIAPFKKCALLAYPHYFNVGDHLIWLGCAKWLADEMHAEIAHTCSIYDFSASRLAERLPEGPIIFRGGGNLGDLWPDYQVFRKKVITAFKNRKIIFLPPKHLFPKKGKFG